MPRRLPPRPVISVFGHAVVGAQLGMHHVAERIPLRRGLRIEVVEVVVEHEFHRAAEILDGVAMRLAGEERRIGNIDRQIQREHLAALDGILRGAHPRRRQQVDGADFVLIAEHAPCRTGGSAFADGELVVAGKRWRRGHRVFHRTRRAGRDFADFLYRRALHPSGRALKIDRCARRRGHDLCNRLGDGSRRFLWRGALCSLGRNCALDGLGCWFFAFDRLGRAFAGLGRRFFAFLFRLCHLVTLLDCMSTTAPSHSRALCDPQITAIQP